MGTSIITVVTSLIRGAGSEAMWQVVAVVTTLRAPVQPAASLIARCMLTALCAVTVITPKEAGGAVNPMLAEETCREYHR